jgi:hypothetical protein
VKGEDEERVRQKVRNWGIERGDGLERREDKLEGEERPLRRLSYYFIYILLCFIALMLE